MVRSLGGWFMIKKLRLKGQDRIRRKVQVEDRDLLCYWAVRELGISCTDLAKQLEMTQPGVGYAVSRGEKIAKGITISCYSSYLLIYGRPACMAIV